MTQDEIYAARFFAPSEELRLLVGAAVLGALLGAVFDILRALRMSVKHSAAGVFVEDTVFSILFGLSFYCYCTELLRGHLRFYILAGMVAGFALYILTLGRIVVKTLGGVFTLAAEGVSTLVKMVKKIIKFLCGTPYFHRKDEKLDETSCTDTD